MIEEEYNSGLVGLFFLPDQLVYMIWKFSQGRRFVKENVLTFWDILPEARDGDGAIILFLNILGILDIPIEGATFYRDDYLKSQEEKIPTISSATLRGVVSPENTRDFEAKTYESFGVKEYNSNAVVYGSSAMLNFFEFSADLSEETMVKLRGFISGYINRFIEDKLGVKNKNFYRFDKQKQALVSYLRVNEEKYGSRFVIEAGSDAEARGIYNFINEDKQEFLFAHTLIALERLGYLTIEDIWTARFNRLTLEKRNTYYTVLLTLGDKFYHEVYPERTPLIDENSLDDKRSILKFAGQDIELARGNKETDAVLLMKALIHSKIGEWEHRDQILDDWGCNEDDLKDLPKNKIYYAKRAINNKVALKTNITDLIEGNTTKVRINPKYRQANA